VTDLQPEVEASDAVGPPDPSPADPAGAPDPAPTPIGPVFRVMDVDDVSLDLPSQYPAVTLVEAEPPMRELVFPVGLPEGTALAQAVRRLEGRRPMTHELFMQVLQRANIDVIAVRLVGREEGTLLAELDLMTPRGRECVDCRPSDGLVLALRMPVPAPILADERLLQTLGDVAPEHLQIPEPREMEP
jgi:bifunctional DNase/RNase